jgi:hypothetical protein
MLRSHAQTDVINFSQEIIPLTVMGQRGPKRQPGVRLRPFVILPEEDAARVQALGAAELARLIRWALPRYPLRREGDTPEAGSEAMVVLRPERPLSPQVAVIRASADGQQLRVRLPERDEAFNSLIKARRFSWDRASGHWVRPLGSRSGSPSDRVAELAAGLLGARFIVGVENARLADLVLRGGWLPEQQRWVELLPGGELLLTWEHGGDAVWAATRHLRGAHWDAGRGGSVIHPQRHADVREFAAQHAFQFTDAAEGALQAAEEAERRQLLALDLPAPLQPHRRPRRARTGEVSVPDDLLAD